MYELVIGRLINTLAYRQRGLQSNPTFTLAGPRFGEFYIGNGYIRSVVHDVA